MKIKKFISILLSLIFILSIFGGCDNKEDYVIYFELDSAPQTLDPQLASSISEELIIRNVFEGLLREDADGKIVSAAAEKYTISADKLTYTFTISSSAKWADGLNVTADDFLFAFERALDPTTKSPSAAALYSIVGAKAINNGEKNVALGVKAINDSTLEIKLVSPNPSFLKTITTSVCMPCRRESFYKAKGRYGKTTDDIITNGSFKIRFWEKNEGFSLRINKSEEYSGNFVAEASAVIFNVGNISGRAVRIADGNLDMGFIDFSEATKQNNLYKFQKTTYALMINNDSVFGSEDFKNAFAMSIHRNRLVNDLSASLNETDMILPNSITIGSKPISTAIVPPTPPKYDPDTAHKLYVKAAKNATNLPSSIELIYYGNEEITNLVEIITDTLQQSLGVVINLKPLESKAALSEALSLKTYQLAIVPLTAQSKDPYQFLEFFSSNSTNNIYGFKNTEFDAEIAKITPTANNDIVSKSVSKALNFISKDGSILPIAHYTEAFCYAKGFVCPRFSPFGGIIDLALVKKSI